MIYRNPEGALTDEEKSIGKALLADGWRNRDIQAPLDLGLQLSPTLAAKPDKLVEMLRGDLASLGVTLAPWELTATAASPCPAAAEYPTIFRGVDDDSTPTRTVQTRENKRYGNASKFSSCVDGPPMQGKSRPGGVAHPGGERKIHASQRGKM